MGGRDGKVDRQKAHHTPEGGKKRENTETKDPKELPILQTEAGSLQVSTGSCNPSKLGA